MAIHFLETENMYLNRIFSIRLAISFYYILRAVLCRHSVAFKETCKMLAFLADYRGETAIAVKFTVNFMRTLLPLV